MALQDLTPQLRTRLHRVEKVVTTFVLVATLLLVTGFAYYLHHTAKRKGWFIPRCPYHTYAMSGEGLAVGDPVMLMGFPVGEITEITAQPPGSWYKVYVAFTVRRPFYGYIWSDSKVKITNAGLLGGRRLELVAGYDGMPTAYEKDGEVSEILVDKKKVPLATALKGPFVPPLEDTALSERASALMTQAEQALPNLLALTNQVRLTLDNAVAISSNAIALTSNAATLTGSANILLTNLTVLLTDARPLLSNATIISSHLTNPQGSLGEWLMPVDIRTNLTRTISNADARLVMLAASLNDILLNVAAITSNLNEQVQTNDQILAEISSLVRQTDDLVQGLKRHWLLRGVFKSGATKTNVPAARQP